MGYKNGKDALPPDLLRQVQQHVQGESLYIPKLQPRTGGVRQVNAALQVRNAHIRLAYRQGVSVQALSQTYYLSPQAIYKILSRKDG